MRSTSSAGQMALSSSRWQMPIHPEIYPDRAPVLTNEEQELMQLYATALASFMTGGRARNVLHQLARFEAPFLDIVHLTSPMDTTVTAARRYLFTWMGRTGRA
jgi:hypothetical protein